MRSRRLLWQIFPAFLALVVLALSGATWHFSRIFHDFYLQQVASDLTVQAQLVEELAAERFVPADAPFLQNLAERLGARTGLRVTLIHYSGVVVGDSAEDPARMENHAQRPEVAAALRGEEGSATRFSPTVRETMLYAAVPVRRGGEVVGVVRTSLPATAMQATLRQLYLQMLAAGLGIAVLAALVGLVISRRLSRPLEEMRRGAERFARGDLQQRLAVSGSEEIFSLAEAMNRMAGELDERMRTVLRQRNEQEAVLASMVEGVLAVDTEARIIRLNQAAARLFGVGPEEIDGRRIQEVIRKPDLQRFVARALASREPVEGDILLRSQEEERFLQAHGTPLRGAEGQEIGALIVLNDVTRLRRLENIRRDFVANVSHELKTPITAIKGFVETLQDGAIEDGEAARRFLGIVTRQADRLNAIIEDLLELSRIEQYAENNEIPLQDVPLDEVLRSALQACLVQATAKEVEIDLACPPGLRARINPPLLEQAVINLVDNAVKYSDAQGQVRVAAERRGNEVLIQVRDWGCGIDKEHLPRLFERFYRVDKARSRKLGGTGLGLAIVKHIAQAHGGRVNVQSAPGEGSAFTIHLRG